MLRYVVMFLVSHPKFHLLHDPVILVFADMAQMLE
jgi:hypothetical protein